MTRIFDKLKIDNIYKLLSLINTNDNYPNALYNYGLYYADKDETEKFISITSLISNSTKDKKISQSIKEIDGSIIKKVSLKKIILEKLITDDNEYSKYFIEYFKLFENVNNLYVYTPKEKDRLKYSGIRNFLYELDVIRLLNDNRTYQFDYDKVFAFSESGNAYKLSPESFSLIQKIKKEIGEKAELCVIEYERRRLSNNDFLLSLIKHVALTDVNAGYDILSWDASDEASEKKPRYIEVKCVQLDNKKRFYWSNNEINIAKKYGDLYYLYLVPREQNNYLIDQVQIIKNPSVNIFEEDGWEYKVENYSIWEST